MVQNAVDKQLIRTNEDLIENIRQGIQTENQYVLDLSTHAHILSQLEEKNYENNQNIDIATATGEALDNLGRLVNVIRIPAQPLRVEITIGTGVALQEAVTVPAGTRVLLQGIFDDIDYDFRTVEDVTIMGGSTEANVYAESGILGYYGSLPPQSVVGLYGFSDLSATNTEASTGGKNIEEDDVYRERIRNWSSNHMVGTRGCIESYLDAYVGLDEYLLVPCFDGAGTLKIVCRTIPDMLRSIANDVYENCMSVTDYPPTVVLPSDYTLQTVEVAVRKTETEIKYTDDELKQMIASSVRSFVNGGTSRDGTIIPSYRIGQNWYPSELIAHLLSEFPELSNVRLSDETIIQIEADQRIQISDVGVVFE